MKRFDLFLLIFLSFILTNCTTNEPVGFEIKGNITGDFNEYVYLKYKDKVDSTLVKEGVFSFKGIVKAPCEAKLWPGSPSSEEIMQLAPFMLENSQIYVSLNYKKKVLNIPEFEGKPVKILKMDSIHGSKSEVLKDNFDAKMGATFYKEKNDRIKTTYLYNNLREFISAHPDFVLSGKYLANLTNRYDLLKSNQIQELFNLLDTTHQNERDIRFVKRIIKRRSILDFGKEPPKIELPNQNNELISHESYKGTFVLLEFWASWCGPCRETNPELIKVYNSFDRKDFEILGISQDKDLNKWKKAIKKDQLTWMQVIDTVNTSGKKYNMTTIPFNVLLDRNGKVIARELKPKKLAEVLQKRLEQEK